MYLHIRIVNNRDSVLSDLSKEKKWNFFSGVGTSVYIK